ncbi:MAG: hypothetical protein AAGA67_09385, partial [Cyanobacteria bacterium P01_F01_bin.153]
MAEFIVTNTNDSGAGSLRDAIAQANSNTAGSLDTIVFSASVFNDPTDVIALTGADIDISQPLIIRGNGATTTIIDGQGNDRIFNSSAELTLENVTIQGGSTTDNGGGVLSSSAVTVINSTISGNSSGGSGGGIRTT